MLLVIKTNNAEPKDMVFKVRKAGNPAFPEAVHIINSLSPVKLWTVLLLLYNCLSDMRELFKISFSNS